MNTYIIMYDLRAPGRNYNELVDAIKSYSNWGRITESTWAIVTLDTAQEVRDKLQVYIDINDRICVVKSARVAAWNNVKADNAWMKNYI